MQSGGKGIMISKHVAVVSLSIPSSLDEDVTAGKSSLVQKYLRQYVMNAIVPLFKSFLIIPTQIYICLAQCCLGTE